MSGGVVTVDECGAVWTDSTGLVWPEKFPLQVETLDTITGNMQTAADRVRGFGSRAVDRMDPVAASWAGLQGCYSSPEAPAVWALMDPAQTAAEEVKGRLDRVGGLLDECADELADLRRTLRDVVDRCVEFRDRVVNGVWRDAASTAKAGHQDRARAVFDWVPGVDERKILVSWDQDQDLINDNVDLQAQYTAVLARVSQVCTSFANQVEGLPVLPLVGVAPGPWTGVGGIDVAAMWGEPVREDRSCAESVGSAGYQFGNKTLGAGSSMIGRDPRKGEGGWSWGTAGRTWWGVGDLVVSVGTYANPVTGPLVWASMAGRQLDRPQWVSWVPQWFDERGQVVQGTAGSMVMVDPTSDDPFAAWKHDPAAVATETGLNLGTVVIPGTGAAGASLKAGSAVRAANVAGHSVEAVFPGASWAVKGTVRGVSGVGDWLRGLRPGGLARTGTGAVRLDPVPVALSTLDRLPERWPTPVSDDLFNPARSKTNPVPATPRLSDLTSAPHDRGPTLPVAREELVSATARTGHPGDQAAAAGQHTSGPGRAADAVTTQAIRPPATTQMSTTGGAGDLPAGRHGGSGSRPHAGLDGGGRSGGPVDTPGHRSGDASTRPDEPVGANSPVDGSGGGAGLASEPVAYIKPGYEPGGPWSDPRARQEWVNDLTNGPDTGPIELRTRRSIANTEEWADYQRRVAGPEEYRLTGGGRRVWADSIHVDPDGITGVDAKFVERPNGRSLYEGGRPDFMYRNLDRELVRYAAVIRDGSNPVARIRILTTTPKAADFLGARARAIMGPDIDIEVVVSP